ncbi:UDP-2,3-diacylglucosamine diphosphatase [Stenotrophomonas indicatrix]|uniref:UDP-2,3-diacylglucosamine diphosphatase n=1 Tax=Stenotrophomonas indicatrix TaxID=2045451 RepID=UPI00111D912E|nr:UDP-2,3-diacylglucosamine diphosphatase [Stenotrophomonas indicatrix]MDN8644246.1 UDP-2,3-diacylglucosamine diphosphatase [Stenotrophomonas indicatrix]MDN8653973.1 UDP-2,3-diacylglucosamine diphosphatase [Stenotrophomonas indicatrix]MDT9581767.1 UDP-2,3-diacylglucosamine diphosphatase [Stenotrophomonas indicatrix]TPD99787.1 UDP-2,3-diacylglucosamine diphosphatase [Stenotrophomonas maltophilia]
MTTLFISDLHLDPSRPAITDLFLRFLREEAPGADALYILGDLFEAWIGDDTPSAAADAVAEALKVLSDSGVPVFFIRGNRDFLLGEDYARRAGLRILPDPCMIELYGRPVLLQHGDLLCTDDIPYQQFRAQTRDPVFQAQFLSQPLEARIAFAQKARDASQARQSEMKQGDRAQFETVTDVAPAEVEATYVRHGVDTMIHGHTHRPAIHTLQAGGRSCTRIVLGDWYEQGSVLRVDANGWTLDTLSRA